MSEPQTNDGIAIQRASQQCSGEQQHLKLSETLSENQNPTTESSGIVGIVSRRCDAYARLEHPGDGKYLSIIASMLDADLPFTDDWFDRMLIDKLRVRIIDAEIMVADDPIDAFWQERLSFLRSMEDDIKQADSLCARNGS